MSYKGCKRKHTPIISKKQRKFFGAELSRAQANKKRKTEMPIVELKKHLKETKGKKLPKKARKKKR